MYGIYWPASQENLCSTKGYLADIVKPDLYRPKDEMSYLDLTLQYHLMIIKLRKLHSAEQQDDFSICLEVLRKTQ
jgi:hypothetical protein